MPLRVRLASHGQTLALGLALAVAVALALALALFLTTGFLTLKPKPNLLKAMMAPSAEMLPAEGRLGLGLLIGLGLP